MIKKYIDFIKESNGYRIPDHFVELNSIGHYLDTLSGEMYPMDADGSFDEDEAFDVYDDLDDHDGLSEDDKRLIDSFRISIEELIGDKINLDLIEDIIDRSISEGLIDENVYINIRAIVRMDHAYLFPIIVYCKDSNIDYTWQKLFKQDADIVRSKPKRDIYYNCVFTYVKRYEDDLKPKMDLIEKIIKQDYPDVQCSFHQLMDNYRTI